MFETLGLTNSGLSRWLSQAMILSRWSAVHQRERESGMCFFLVVAVPTRHVALVGEVFARGFQVYPTANLTVAAAVPEQHDALVITSGMCSCGPYARPNVATASDRAAHLRRKYVKLGWNEAKIQRALEQSGASGAKPSRPSSGVREDVASGLSALCRAAGSIAVCVHWYNGDIDTERFTLGKPLRCSCAELPARLQALGEDSVLIATPRPTDEPSAGAGSRSRCLVW